MKSWGIALSALFLIAGTWLIFKAHQGSSSQNSRQIASRSLVKNSNEGYEKSSSAQYDKNKGKQKTRRPAQQKPQFSQQRVINTSRKKLQELKDCYKHEACSYPKTDPKSYFFAVGQDLKKELFRLQGVVVQKEWESDEIAQVARDFLTIEDGHVKEAALHLISTQPTNDKSLDALLNEVIHFYDPKLIQHAMLELRRYLGSADEQKIHQSLSQALQTGSPAVAQEVARSIAPFVNKNSFEVYLETLNAMPPHSKSYRNLKASVEEYEKKQTAA